VLPYLYRKLHAANGTIPEEFKFMQCEAPALHTSRLHGKSKHIRPHRDMLDSTSFLIMAPVCLSRLAQRIKKKIMECSSNVILTGANGNVIMSGCGDDNPDNARRETDRDRAKSVSR